jgi:ubiquinone/menaquinone biosynthesis C-methylase UbiE
MAVIYDDLWTIGEVERWARQQPCLRPRTPGHLFELVSRIGLDRNASILDVGCGQGDHARELATRFGAHVVALDPVESSVLRARQRVEEESLTGQVDVEQGVIEDLRFADATFDLVWCRSVIVHLRALGPAFRQCSRVLVPGGSMMLQTGYRTGLLEAQEAAILRQRLGFVEASMDRSLVEASFLAAGFTITRSESYGSEFAETYEAESGRCAHDLVGIARLQRVETPLVEQFGRAAYETALGMYYWQVYQMLGKISYHAYLLTKSR